MTKGRSPVLPAETRRRGLPMAGVHIQAEPAANCGLRLASAIIRGHDRLRCGPASPGNLREFDENPSQLVRAG